MNQVLITIGFNTLLSVALYIAQRAGRSRTPEGALTPRSLPELSKSTRITAPVLIERRLANADPAKMSALMQTILSIYSAYYLQAVDYIVGVNGVSAVKLLDKVASDRTFNVDIAAKAHVDTAMALTKMVAQGVDSAKTHFGLSSLDDGVGFGIPAFDCEIGLEAIDVIKTIHNITDESNLAVGKIIDVTLGVVGSGEKAERITIPVMVNLAPHVYNGDNYLSILELLSTDKTSEGRKHQFKSGDISLKDYLFCTDIIEKEKQALLADKTGFFNKLLRRETANQAIGLAHGYSSPNEINAIHVISAQTAADLQIRIGGKLTSASVRKKFFESTLSMMLVVVDLTKERFTLYQRGIDEFGDFTFTDIKDNNKKPNGVDINAIMNSYKLGQAANF